MFGKLLGSVIRIVNVPAKAVEKLFDAEDDPIISAPLDALAEAFEDVDKD
jgi:hypothetical protein